MIGRRGVLGGIAAGAVLAGRVAAQDDLGAALDAAARDPAAGLRALARFDADALPVGRRLDLETARAGLAIDAEIARAPKGAAVYALRLQRRCGSDIDPTAAVVRLETERDALLARADRLFRRIGLRGGSVGERYSALWSDPRHLYSDDDAGRARAIADMARDLAAARNRAREQLDPLPAFCLDAGVRALSPAEIAAGKRGYREVPAPGRPGAYVVDLAAIRRRPAWTLPSVVAHELIPGHMVQLGLENESPPHPLRLEYASAFVEGWGIYAETLAPYPTPLEELGHIHWLLFRIDRAIVDLRIHLHGWGADQARAALVAWQGEPAYFAPFDTELARIAAEPGVRAGEALAWLAIADATRGLTGPPLVARRRAILAGGRKRTEQIGSIQP